MRLAGLPSEARAFWDSLQRPCCPPDAPYKILDFPGCCLCRLSLRTETASLYCQDRPTWTFLPGRGFRLDGLRQSLPATHGEHGRKERAAPNPASHLPSRRTDSRVTDD